MAEVMRIFLVLVWCRSVADTVFPDNSRFGGFNSRLGPNKFPFSWLRELAGNGLICLAIFVAKTAKQWGKTRNSRFFPVTTGICPNEDGSLGTRR
jgi:hypothetical protein